MRALLAIIIIVVGVLAIIAGILYLTQPAHDLPSFFPGYVAHAAGKHPKRGVAGLVIGGILIIVGLVVAASGRPR